MSRKKRIHAYRLPKGMSDKFSIVWCGKIIQNSNKIAYYRESFKNLVTCKSCLKSLKHFKIIE